MLFSLKEKLSSSFHISDIFCLLNQMVYYIFFKWLKHSSNDWDIVKYLCPDFRPVLNVPCVLLCLIPLSAAKTSRHLMGFQSKTPSEIQNLVEFQFFSKTLWNLILSPKPCWLAISLPKHDWVSLSSSFTSFPSFPPQFLSAYSSYSFLPPPSF